MPPIAHWIIGGLIAALGLAAAAAALFRDRPRGRLRCPKCWYDFTGIQGLTCPECGRTAKSPRHLRRTRRRPRRFALGLLLTLVGALTALWPRLDRQWLADHLPVTAHILILPSIDDPKDPFLARILPRRIGNESWYFHRSFPFSEKPTPAPQYTHLRAWQRRLLAIRAARMFNPASQPWTHETAGRVLVGLGPDASHAVPLLVAALADAGTPDAQRDIAAALGAIGPAAAPAVAGLVALLPDPGDCEPEGSFADYEAIGAAMHALARIGPDAAPATERLKAMLVGRSSLLFGSEAAEALGCIGEPAHGALPELAAALRNGASPAVAAAVAIGRIGPDDDAASALARALTAEDAILREAAAWSLIRHRTAAAGAVPHAIDVCDNGDDPAKMCAAMGLGLLGSEAAPAVGPLLGLLQSQDPMVRYAAILGLEGIGDASADVLEAVERVERHDPDESVRAAAREAGWKLRTKSALSPLHPPDAPPPPR